MTKDDGWGKGNWETSPSEPIKVIEQVWPIEAPWPSDANWLPNVGQVIKEIDLKKQGSNLVDAQAYLYFQCESCQDILDPHTKSFAKLQQNRVDKGWLCVWNIDGMGYKVYCPKCGDGK